MGSLQHNDTDGVAEKDELSADAYDKIKAENWGIALGYTYPFSKRTFVYTYASYNELKGKFTDSDGTETGKEKDTEFGFGLVHKF